MAQSPCFYLPLLIPFCPLSDPLYLLGNPPSCDRIRPPWSQVACKLTSPFSTLSQPSPLQIPRTQVIKRLTMTTSRIRLLLSGTLIHWKEIQLALLLKGQKHEIFDLRFFPSNEHTWAPDIHPKIFSNSVSNSLRYSNSKFDWPQYNIAASQKKCKARRVLEYRCYSPWVV